MGRTKIIVSGIAWTVIQNIVNVLYGLVSVPFLIHYFGKEEYGLIGLALSVNVYVQLLDMGMTNSNVRFFSEYIAKGDAEKEQKLFSLTHSFYTIVGIINTLVLFGISFYVDSLFKVTEEQAVILRNLLWILALNATFSWISVCFDQYLRANDLIDWIKRRSTLLKVLQFVFLIATICFYLSIEVYFLGYIFIATIILPLTILKVKKINPSLQLNWKFDTAMFKTIYPYAISIFSFSICQFLAFNFRPLILGNISGPGAVAEFNIMNTIAMVVTIFSTTFVQVLLPVVTKMRVLSDSKGIESIMQRGTKYANLLLCVIIFLLISAIEELVTLYVGKEYTSLCPWIILWLLTLLLAHRNVMTSLVFTENKLHSVAIMGFVAMCLAMFCYFWLTPKFGVGGVVIGFIVHELTHTLFYYFYFIPHKFQINTLSIFLRSILPAWIGIGLICVMCRLFLSDLDLPYYLVLALKVIVFIILFSLFACTFISKEEKCVAVSMIRNYNKRKM